MGLKIDRLQVPQRQVVPLAGARGDVEPVSHLSPAQYKRLQSKVGQIWEGLRVQEHPGIIDDQYLRQNARLMTASSSRTNTTLVPNTMARLTMAVVSRNSSSRMGDTCTLNFIVGRS